ncbi:MAG TPA: DinB family protein, partial [Patescibacteria group bacterium]|nr:DinB family protein [Patescibacteria group bacterium]
MHFTPNTMRSGRTLFRVLLSCLLAPASLGLAQEKPGSASAPPTNPLTDNSKFMFRGLKYVLIRSAEKMPEENYAFKPTESVRGFGQILGHVADAQYLFCSEALGEKSPSPGIEKTRTTKADLTAALKDAFAYCDKAYEGLTDTSAGEMVKHGGSDM